MGWAAKTKTNEVFSKSNQRDDGCSNLASSKNEGVERKGVFEENKNENENKNDWVGNSSRWKSCCVPERELGHIDDIATALAPAPTAG